MKWDDYQIARAKRQDMSLQAERFMEDFKYLHGEYPPKDEIPPIWVPTEIVKGGKQSSHLNQKEK